MLHETISLREKFPALKTDATLQTFVRSISDEIEPDRRRAGVLICPGGAYYMVSDREAEPVALEFVARGYNAFVLTYSTADRTDCRYPDQLLEVSAALAWLRRSSERYHLKPDSLCVCGFSAGGHLACSLGALWNEPFVAETLGLAPGENRPDGMILAYPVITGGEYANRASFDYLLGPDPAPALLQKLSLENSVGPHTPPAFIWHTLNDEAVPIQNSFLLSDALQKSGVPFELHIFPTGFHGGSLGTRESRSPIREHINPHIAQWMDLCGQWIADYIDK